MSTVQEHLINRQSQSVYSNGFHWHEIKILRGSYMEVYRFWYSGQWFFSNEVHYYGRKLDQKEIHRLAS